MTLRKIRGSLARAFGGLRSERAAALVEFALVVPFLMIIMCATIDFGLAVYTLNNLTAAVREGGRYAATLDVAPGVDTSVVRDRVYAYIVAANVNGLTPMQVKEKIHNTAPDPNGNIVVWIDNYPFVPMTPLAPLLGMQTIGLTRRAVFRYERAS
jgi:Flp pilus assembly protein TadG